MSDKAVNIEGLVASGYLDLESCFRYAAWVNEGPPIGSYVSNKFGVQGNEPGTFRVVLQRAEAYGLVVYRWTEETSDHYCGIYLAGGDLQLDRDAAREDAKAYLE